MAICAHALVRKNEWRARAHTSAIREQASKRTLFLLFFLPIVYACMREHALLFFFSPLRRPMYKGYIVFQACSRCRRRFTSIYYSLTNERKEEKEKEKENVKQAIGRVRIWITTPFLFLYMCVHYIAENQREKERKKGKREEYKHFLPTKYTEAYHDEKTLQNSIKSYMMMLNSILVKVLYAQDIERFSLEKKLCL
jgi:hypothetical protein